MAKGVISYDHVLRMAIEFEVEGQRMKGGKKRTQGQMQRFSIS